MRDNDGRVVAYYCQGEKCLPPVRTVPELMRYFEGDSGKVAK